MINRELFYKNYRNMFGSIRENKTVEVINTLLDVFENNIFKVKPLEKLAYIFATIRHECGANMLPKIENLRYSAKRLMQVWPSRFPNYSIAKKYAYSPQALGNKVYGGRMGNGVAEGYKFRGRGLVQITGYNNYKKFSEYLQIDMINNPDLALDIEISAKIIYFGMEAGMFTGRKLSGYISPNKTDYYSARSIINGDRGRVGRRIASDAEKFEKILKNSIID